MPALHRVFFFVFNTTPLQTSLSTLSYKDPLVTQGDQFQFLLNTQRKSVNTLLYTSISDSDALSHVSSNRDQQMAHLILPFPNHLPPFRWPPGRLNLKDYKMSFKSLETRHQVRM